MGAAKASAAGIKAICLLSFVGLSVRGLASSNEDVMSRALSSASCHLCPKACNTALTSKCSVCPSGVDCFPSIAESVISAGTTSPKDLPAAIVSTSSTDAHSRVLQHSESSCSLAVCRRPSLFVPDSKATSYFLRRKCHRPGLGHVDESREQ